jgi:hypothetical protein
MLVPGSGPNQKLQDWSQCRCLNCNARKDILKRSTCKMEYGNLECLWKCSNVEWWQEAGGRRDMFRESGVISNGLREIFVKSCPSKLVRQHHCFYMVQTDRYRVLSQSFICLTINFLKNYIG